MQTEQRADESDLVAHLTRTTRLTADEATKVIREVTDYLSETVSGYVQRRHGELKQQGELNEAIYPMLVREIRQRHFRAEEYSERQIRRLIYG